MRASKESNDVKQVACALAFTIPQFCESHGISRALFYVMRRDGRAPRIMKVGRRTLIARESAEAWRRAMEEGSRNGAA